MDEITVLKIDPEFRDLIPPLSREEYEELENSLLEEGCREPIHVWYKTIIDGHNRYEICSKHNLPFKLSLHYFKNRHEAMVWICTNQLARRNVSDSVRRYLIGKRYHIEKVLGAHNASGTNQFTSKKQPVLRSHNDTKPFFESAAGRAREKLGDEYHLCPATVSRYAFYSNAVDVVKEVSPEVAKLIITGRVKVKQTDLIALSRRPVSEIKLFCNSILKDTKGAIPYSVTRELMPQKTINKKITLPANTGAIKEMPVYDPDAELKSLMFTIPSWVKSIDRVLKSKEIPCASDTIKASLTTELCKLLTSTSIMLQTLKENSDNG